MPLEHCYPADQHIVEQVGAVVRYRRNHIISDLITAATHGQVGPCLNEIAKQVALGRYSEAERAELYRLIGYSLSGFEDVFPTADD